MIWVTFLSDPPAAATPAEVEALRAEVIRAGTECADAMAQVVTLRARVARLEEAVRPFAAADKWEWSTTAWHGVKPEEAQVLYNSKTEQSITLADFFTARIALEATP
jgi:hypothetical protein